MEAIVSRTLSVHKEHELLLKLEAAGLTDDLAQRVIVSKDNDLAAKVVRLIANGGFEPSISHKRAREIMGRNMFDVENAIRNFGLTPSKQQIAALAEIPFSEATLKACKESHVLVAVLPFSILEIRGKVAGSDQRLFYEQDWYNKQVFAKDKGEAEWQLVRKTPVADSPSKTWDEQQVLLGKDEETPKARVVVYAIIGHFLATAERLFEKIYVRCVDVDSGGSRVDVGDFGAGGLGVYSGRGDGRYGDLGVSAARKSE